MGVDNLMMIETNNRTFFNCITINFGPSLPKLKKLNLAFPKKWAVTFLKSYLPY